MQLPIIQYTFLPSPVPVTTSVAILLVNSLHKIALFLCFRAVSSIEQSLKNVHGHLFSKLGFFTFSTRLYLAEFLKWKSQFADKRLISVNREPGFP